MEHLLNLRQINLIGNPIREDELDLVEFEVLEADELVRYCQEKIVAEAEKNFVIVKGRNYYVKNDTLCLDQLGITDITEVKGLERLSKLSELDLRRNRIQEIKGLEQLTKLRSLHHGHNEITEIKELENFKSLEK